VLVIATTVVLSYRAARRKVEIALDHTVAALRSVLDNAPVAIIATTQDGRITHFNPGAERLLGYSQAEALGRPLASFHDPKELADLSRDHLPHFETLVTDPRPMARTTRVDLVRKDGRRLRVHMALQAHRRQGRLVLMASTSPSTVARRPSAPRAGQRVEKLAAQIPAPSSVPRHADQRRERLLSPGVRASSASRPPS
jgi:PAS domain S-box-containing protein